MREVIVASIEEYQAYFSLFKVKTGRLSSMSDEIMRIPRRRKGKRGKRKKKRDDDDDKRKRKKRTGESFKERSRRKAI
jgi:hypothetical protein